MLTDQYYSNTVKNNCGYNSQSLLERRYNQSKWELKQLPVSSEPHFSFKSSQAPLYSFKRPFKNNPELSEFDSPKIPFHCSYFSLFLCHFLMKSLFMSQSHDSGSFLPLIETINVLVNLSSLKSQKCFFDPFDILPEWSSSSPDDFHLLLF